MRLLTDEQHAQIVEALKWANTVSTKSALATLTAAPSVEVVGYEVWAAMCEPELSRTKGGIKSLMKKLYAIKKETP